MKEKVTYLIIFILLLVSTLLYIQIRDFNSVTTILVEDNKHNQQINQELKKELDIAKSIVVSQNKTIEDQKIQIETLNDTIIGLQEQISNMRIYNGMNSSIYDNNYTTTNQQLIEDQNLTNQQIDQTQQNSSTQILPSVEVNDENKITKFGVEYHQKF